MAASWPSKFVHLAQQAINRPKYDIESPDPGKELDEPSGPKLTATMGDIVAAIDIHRHFRRPGITKEAEAPKAIDWLPLLDTMDLYDINDTVRSELSCIEAGRLHQAMKAPKQLRFDMGEPLGIADSTGYAKLDAAGWKLIWCFILC